MFQHYLFSVISVLVVNLSSAGSFFCSVVLLASERLSSGLMIGREWENGMIVSSYCGSFPPHSLAPMGSMTIPRFIRPGSAIMAIKRKGGRCASCKLYWVFRSLGGRRGCWFHGQILGLPFWTHPWASWGCNPSKNWSLELSGKQPTSSYLNQDIHQRGYLGSWIYRSSLR